MKKPIPADLLALIVQFVCGENKDTYWSRVHGRMQRVPLLFHLLKFL